MDLSNIYAKRLSWAPLHLKHIPSSLDPFRHYAQILFVNNNAVEGKGLFNNLAISLERNIATSSSSLREDNFDVTQHYNTYTVEPRFS